MSRNTLLFGMVALLLAAAGAAGGYWFAKHRMAADMPEAPGTSTSEPASVPAPVPASVPASVPAAAPASGGKSATADRRVLYWHDPMVPGPKFDKPGKSPFMDMQLVPVYADDGADDGKVTINPRTLQNLGIRIAEVKASHMQTRVAATGAVSVDERTLGVVQLRVNGYIEKLHVRAQYDAVARGQPLAEIYAPEWLAAQEEYLVLMRSTRADAQPLAQAARARLALLGVSEKQIQRIEQGDKPEPRVTVYAPASGVVWEIGVREGMAVNPATLLFKLASLASVWVNAEVRETEAALVRPGMPVAARAAAFPETVYKGSVAALLPDVSAATRTIKARIVLANPGGRLKPGMFVNIDFATEARAVLMAPSEAVIHTGKRKVVIIAEDGGKFRPTEIEAGRDSGDMTEILKGLVAGQKVVASGQFLIDSEASLKSALGRLQSTADAGATEAPGAAVKNAVHTGSARVNQVDAKEGTLELAHGPIPSMKWPAMTMGFRVADKALLAPLKAGDEIEFDMRGTPDKHGDYVITRIAARKAGGAR